MATYNGHKNWNHWNVSLWINNDEGLYYMAKEYANNYRKEAAARLMFHQLTVLQNITKTPDGARYSVSSIRAAMVGM